MKNIYLFIPFLLTLLLLPACDNDTHEPEEPKAKVKLEVKLRGHGSKVTNSINEEIVSSIKFNMDEIQSLIYLVHEAESGKFFSFFNISKNDLEPVTTEGITTIEDNLPFGQYYISLVAMTEDIHFNSEILNKLAVNYEKAVFHTPNSHLFYATTKIDCRPAGELASKENIEVVEEMELDLLTGEFIIMLPKGSKGIPTGANFDISIKVNNLPCAFFLKNAKTVNSEEEKELQAWRYNDAFEINKPYEKQLTAKYHYINNTEFEDTAEGRGSFQLIYKEDAESDVITSQLDIIFSECPMAPGPPRHQYVHIQVFDLYSGTIEEVTEF